MMTFVLLIQAGNFAFIIGLFVHFTEIYDY